MMVRPCGRRMVLVSRRKRVMEAAEAAGRVFGGRTPNTRGWLPPASGRQHAIETPAGKKAVLWGTAMTTWRVEDGHARMRSGAVERIGHNLGKIHDAEVPALA